MDEEVRAKPARSEYRRKLPHLQRPGRTFFVTFGTRGRWQLPESVRGLVLHHCLRDHKTKMIVHGAVVMPDHVHLVVTPLKDCLGATFGLSEVIGGVKRWSAHSVNNALGRRGRVWQGEYFDRMLRSDEDARRKVEYVCMNPVRRGLAADVEDYPWLWREWVEGARDQSAG